MCVYNIVLYVYYYYNKGHTSRLGTVSVLCTCPARDACVCGWNLFGTSAHQYNNITYPILRVNYRPAWCVFENFHHDNNTLTLYLYSSGRSYSLQWSSTRCCFTIGDRPYRRVNDIMDRVIIYSSKVLTRTVPKYILVLSLSRIM